MSVAISWRGSVESGREDDLLSAVRSFCEDMEWAVTDVEVDTGPPAEGGQGKLAGLALLPHLAVDPLPLVILPEGGELIDAYVEDLGDGRRLLGREPMISTLHGGPEVHQEIAACLEIVAAHCGDFAVDDESGWWVQRDEEALENHFDAAWEEFVRGVAAGVEPGATQVEVAGFALDLAPPEEPPALAPEAAQLLEAMAQGFAIVYGGLGRDFGADPEGILNLELVLDDVLEDDEWKALRTTEEGERLVYGAGAIFGRQLGALLGGRWVQEDGALLLHDVGRCGLRLDPFELVVTRLEQGPVHALTSVVEIVARLAGSFGRG